MLRTTWLPSCALALTLLTGCSGDAAPPAGTTSAAPSGSATTTAKTTASASPTASAAPAKTATAKALSKEDKKKLAKHLGDGRKLAGKKAWKEAIKEFEAALEVSPRDARVLGELGWAAFNDKDLARAKSATTLALGSTSDPKLRAQVLYTRGRAAEEAGDKEAAKKDYAESLTLRDNNDVSKHFVAVGGKLDEIVPRWSTCTAGYATIDELCGCLKKKAGELLITGEAGKTTCEKQAVKADLGDARLSVVRLATEEIPFGSAFFLVAEDDKKLRAVEMIGQDYEPGAFGVHDTFEVKGGKKLAKGAIVAVHHIEEHYDANLAGLEVCTETREADTLCVLGQKGSATYCARTIPVELSSGCGPGVEPDPADLDPETAELVKSIKATAGKETTKATWSVDDAGKLTVKLTEGKESDYPKVLLAEVNLLAH